MAGVAMAVAGLSAWVLYQAAFIERCATAGGRRWISVGAGRWYPMHSGDQMFSLPFRDLFVCPCRQGWKAIIG